jgi:hypothetical protein
VLLKLGQFWGWFGTNRGIVLALVILAMGTFARALHPLLTALGAGMVLILAIVLGLVIGFIGGAIWAFVYNIAASNVGPIEMELEMKV